MLNELYHLSMALERASITPHDWHKELKPLPNASTKKPCFKIVLDEDGSIIDIITMKNELVSVLRKWEPSNGSSFPGFNIQPLYRITKDEQKECLKRWREGRESIDIEDLKKWCSSNSSNLDSRSMKKLENCLGEIPKRLKAHCGIIPDEFIAIAKLIDRTSVKELYSSFFQMLESYVTKKVSVKKEILSLLVHEGSPNKKPKDDRGSVSVFLDVSDHGEYPVAHEKTIEWINDRLLNIATMTEMNTARKSTNDAFGSDRNGDCKKFPEVKLPVLGGVKLRAMNSESLCQYRYGTIDSNSFPVGDINRMRVKGALEWLGAKIREGETWGQVDGREIVFAYPTTISESPPKLAACFGTRKANDTEDRFANYASDVIDSLRGLGTPLKDIELHVFSLRKMDKARTKVVFHRNYNAQRLADAASEWQQGCDNIPEIQMKIWGKEKGKLIIAKPEAPFPLHVAKCLNNVWKVDGKTKNLFNDEVKVLERTTGIDLLLDDNIANRQVPHLLAVALNNTKTLFTYLGDNLHRNETLKNNDNYQYMPAIIGLLLWKLGIRKEHYMSNSPYLVGRILKVADEIHALYCKELRKNKLPPQLLGNALMVAALEAPTQALSQLALRIVPYLGWAKTNTTDSVGLSRYFLKEFGEIEATMRNETLPDRLNDAERAQLLLGYISSNTQQQTVTNERISL